MRLIHHFACMSLSQLLLWLVLVWYLVMVALHFEASPRLWLNALGMSLIVGSVLLLSVRQLGSAVREFWRVFRLYAIPFCVSSFSALVRDHGFYAIFAPGWHDNLIALLACTLFALGVALMRRLEQHRPASTMSGH